MILNAYTIYDRKALQYHTPFFAAADGAAVRSVQDAVNDPNTSLSRHPNDYVLYRCGAYDDANGSLLPATVLAHIVDLNALVTKQGEFWRDVADITAPLGKGSGNGLDKYQPTEAVQPATE